MLYSEAQFDCADHQWGDICTYVDTMNNLSVDHMQMCISEHKRNTPLK